MLRAIIEINLDKILRNYNKITKRRSIINLIIKSKKVVFKLLHFLFEIQYVFIAKRQISD